MAEKGMVEQVSNERASVIIPVWNGRQYLPACLDALLAQDYPDFEVIAVDNASTDGSADFVAKNYPQVRLIRNKGNLGFAGGCNVGLKVAQGGILVLLNQDTRVRPNWLRVLSDALQDHKIGVAGCKIFYPDGETIQHAGTWIEWPLGLPHHYGQGERDTGAWDTPRTVEYVTGAAMAFRRDVLEHIGPLDEEFWPAYFEDVDFCFRAREAGYEVWYIPDAVLVHEETTSLTDRLLVSQFGQRGRLRFLLKHMPPEQFLSQFIPAEVSYQLPAIHGNESEALRTAYLEAVLKAAFILHRRWQADRGTIYEVVAALQRLHHLAWAEDWKKVEESVAVTTVTPIPSAHLASDVSTTVASILPLQEFEFRSEIPIVGPLISRFHSLWYSLAARWAVRDLIRQQEAINQQQEAINQQQEAINRQQEAINRQQEAINRQQGLYIRSLERRLTTLAEENVFLAREIARLTLQLGPNEE
jgi:GT2 family glycosyltransferase